MVRPNSKTQSVKHFPAVLVIRFLVGYYLINLGKWSLTTIICTFTPLGAIEK